MLAPLRRLAARFSSPTRRTERIVHARRFDAAQADRLTESWTTSTSAINSEIYNSLRSLRARSRDLYNNNEHARAFFTLLVNNVVGPDGVSFQSRARGRDGQLDQLDNDAMEARMRAWSKRGQCDVSRRMTRSEMERLFVLMLARDGEVLVVQHQGFSNDQRYALEFMDPDLLDIDYNVDGQEGRPRIVMGVEVDAFYAPVAYHFLTQHPSPFQLPQAQPSGQRVRIPAERVAHAFVQLRPLQVRGVPWMHAAMRALRDLGGYREAAVIASRVGAAKMGFYTSPDGLSAPHDGRDSTGVPTQAAEAGRFEQLPAGVTLSGWDPDYPHEQFEVFNKAMLRGLSASLGVSYHSLNNDLESVNLSSARIGQQPERDLFRTVQQLLISSLHEWFYPNWLALQLVPMGIPMARFDKFEEPSWLPRTWPSPDPLKDAQTADLMLKNKLTSPPRVIRERGQDPDEILREWEQWEQRLSDLGMTQSEVPVDEGTQTSEETDENA